MSNPWKARVAGSSAIVIVAITLFATVDLKEVDWYRFWSRTNSVVQPVAMVTTPFFLLGAMLIAWRRASRVAIALLCAGIIVGSSIGALALVQEISYQKAGPGWLRVAGSIYLALSCISLALLWLQKLRAGIDAARTAAVVVVVLLMLIHAAALYAPLFPRESWFMALRAIFGTLAFLYLVLVSWLLAFRQSPAPNRPPIDCSRVIVLTCPRCGSAENIAAGHGECANCRLQFTISLEEGMCRSCRYPLRGLTGDKCPECGAAIARSGV